MKRREGTRRPTAEVGLLGGTAPGLSPEEATRRLELHGPGEIPAEPRTPVWRRVLQRLRDPLILVLLVAAALSDVGACSRHAHGR
ncbi:cation-transporting P-type ATPase [Streptomyces sp. NPDC047880]|uniref:cation-transporting P-type ATPase n=1 Tax=Streptomyces sp. NPDC047880 TaxID=3155626 RepID=UPI00345466BB